MTAIVTYLKQSDIFYQLTQTQLELIANICREEAFSAGQIVFEENSSSKELYIIAHGEVEIVVNPAMVSGRNASGSPEKVVIATLKRGQSFGEVALVDEGLRSATTRASVKDTHLLIIPRDKLIMLCETYPQLGYRLMYNLAADLAMKMRNTDMKIREKAVTSPQSK
jgi:CRP/FNR family transcriptional regulator, cyclic AMP receptor protein